MVGFGLRLGLSSRTRLTGESRMQESDPTEMGLRGMPAEAGAPFLEVQETLQAIRSGEVNAVVVDGPAGGRILTLQSAQLPYRILVEQMQEGAATCTPDGIVLYANRRFAEMLRMPLEQVVGASLPSLVVDRDRRALAAMLLSARAANRGTGQEELSLQTSDGTAIPAHLSANTLTVGDQRVVCLVASDLTERKLAEEIVRKLREELACRVDERISRLQATLRDLGNELRTHQQLEQNLRTSEQQYRAIADSAHDWESWIGTDGRPRWISPSVERITGCSAKECLAMPDYPLPLVHEEDREQVALYHRQVLDGQALNDRPFRVRTKTGSVRWVAISAQPVCDHQGTCLGCRSSIRDITERKRTEDALKRTRDDLRNILDSSPDMIISVDLERRITNLNPAAQAALGYSPDELIGQPVQMLYAEPEEARRVQECMEKTGRFCGEIVNRTKKGRRFYAHLESSPLYDERGNVRGAMGVSRDITEHKRVQEALRESEERLTLALRGTQEGVWDWNLETDAVWYSPRYKEMLGYAQDEIEPNVSAWKRLLHPDDQTRALAVLDGVLHHAQEYIMEFRLRHKDGHYMDILSRGFPVRREPGGPIIRIVGTHFDLTERKQTEEKLRASEQRFRLVQEMSLDGFTILDAVREESGAIVDFRWVYVNPAAGRLLGHAPEELIGRRLLDVLPGNRTNSDLFDRYVRVVETGQPHDCELQYESDEIRGWFRNMAFKLNGGIAVHFSDITARKRAESERETLFAVMRKSHEDLLSILDQLRQGIFMTDREGRITFANQGCRFFLGDKVDRAYGHRWSEWCPFTPEDRAALQEMIQRPPGQRTKIGIGVRREPGHRHFMEVDILDDPRDPDRKLFFVYDLTEVRDLRRMLDAKGTVHGMVGQSQVMQAVYRQIEDLAAVDSTVLIEGETGTGKELVAQAIHATGIRSDKVFLPVNCAGLTDSLIGSQLFGHKRGAFTGAFTDHRGVFETAHGGTVFLDEIGDIPLSMQTNLLRVLQEKEITRLGESTPRRVDIRIIAATNQDLDQLVREGRFRQDLLYRVRVARVVTPPLREHREDIPLLTEHFVSETRKRINKAVTAISDQAMDRLLAYHWPGNVRELQSAIEFACIACKGVVIGVGDLPPELSTPCAPLCPAPNAEENARDHLLRAIQASNGSRTAAARLLGISRATLYRRLRELHLDAGSLP